MEKVGGAMAFDSNRNRELRGQAGRRDGFEEPGTIESRNCLIFPTTNTSLSSSHASSNSEAHESPKYGTICGNAATHFVNAAQSRLRTPSTFRYATMKHTTA